MTDPPRKGVKLIMLHLSFFYHKYKRTKYHIYQSFSSCIDLIFTNQPNLVTDSGVHPWLHSNCHHQIVYAKFNFKVIYPPPYVRHIWHYNHEKSETINERVSILINTIINIMSNCLPDEAVTIDNRDPPWINDKIKNLIQTEKRLYKNYLKKIIMMYS